MRYCFMLILGLAVLRSFAQQDTRIWGQVTDAETGLPLPRATVLDIAEGVLSHTSDSGYFSLRVSLPAELSVSYVGYETIRFNLKKAKSDTLRLALKPSASTLQQVEVLPELPKHLFFGSRETQVIDYEFWNNDMLIGVYNYFHKKCYAVLLGENNKILAESPLPANFQRFYKSCINKYYAVSENDISEIRRTPQGLQMTHVTLDLFYKKVVHYAGYYKHYFYLTQQSKSKQSQMYFLEDTKQKIIYDQAPFAFISNTETESKARQLSQAIKADRAKAMEEIFPFYDPHSEGDFLQDFDGMETFGGMIMKQRFEKQYVEHPIYAPFFQEDSIVIVFDFHKRNQQLRFGPEGDPRDSINVSFHLTPGWQQWVYKSNAKRYFTSFINGSGQYSLHALNIADCSLSSSFNIYYRDIADVKVRDGYVYYLHTPGEKSNNVFLFREKWQQ